MYFESNREGSTLSNRENVFWAYALDCGFEYMKVQGLFRKISSRRGIGRSGSLDPNWMAQNRNWEGRKTRLVGEEGQRGGCLGRW
jgi:hypothetical protein